MKIILKHDEELPVELLSALKQAGYHVDTRLLPNLPGNTTCFMRSDSAPTLYIERQPAPIG